MQTDPRLLLLSPGGTVYVLRDQIAAGEALMVESVAVSFPQALGLGHKIARIPVEAGNRVITCGAPIGQTSRAIALGDQAHLHNLISDYTATYSLNGVN